MSRGLTIALAGDVMLGRIVNEAIARFGFDYPWGNVLPALRRADLRLINLECALTDHQERWAGDPHKPFFFRTDSANIETLRVAEIDFATIANNHIGDFGTVGLLDTIRNLDSSGIAHAGAGTSRSEAASPTVLDHDGYRVGVVAFADHPNEWAAGADSPGLNLCHPGSQSDEDFAPVARAIEQASSVSDLVVFTIHWGPNMRDRPSEKFREFARRVIDAGADVFWGHSAHVIQGIEVYQCKPILYDTGDFIDDYIVDEDLRNDLSALFLLRIENSHPVRLELVPVKIDRAQVNFATGADRAWFAQRVTQLCGEMGTSVSDEGDRLSIQIP